MKSMAAKSYNWNPEKRMDAVEDLSFESIITFICWDNVLEKNNRFNRYDSGLVPGADFQNGVEIAEINGPSANSAIQEYDRIIRVGNILVDTEDQLKFAIGMSGGDALIYYLRGENLYYTRIRFGDNWNNMKGSVIGPSYLNLAKHYNLGIRIYSRLKHKDKVEVFEVPENSVGKLCGLKKGDLITGVNGHQINRVHTEGDYGINHDFFERVNAFGRSLTVSFLRDGQEYLLGPLKLQYQYFHDDVLPVLENCPGEGSRPI